jgi:hypothetical protein
MAVTTNKPKTEGVTWRRYKDGESEADFRSAQDMIFQSSWTHKCPEYVLSTPPCQGSCPAGEDIRGYLNIVRGIEKPPAGVTWQEYAFRRITEANPFPGVMGRVCPAPCESGCNRNMVEDHVGINAVEHFVGDWGIENNMAYTSTAAETGKKSGRDRSRPRRPGSRLSAATAWPRRHHFRRARRARRHDALRHSGLPHPA